MLVLVFVIVQEPDRCLLLFPCLKGIVDLLRRDREVTDTNADGVLDGVGDGGRHRRHRILADSFDLVRSDSAACLDDDSR